MPHPTIPVAVRHPENGRHVVLNPATDYEPDDILVKAYPWAFEPLSKEPVLSVGIEKASASPGEKRTRTKR